MARIITLILFTVFLILVAIIPKVVADDANPGNIPPPLPEHKWVGKTRLNYTALHHDFVETLVCSKVPVGVFGYYMWLISSLTAALLIRQFVTLQLMILATSNPLDESIVANPAAVKRPSIKTILVGILSIAWSMLCLVLDGLTLSDCRGANGFSAIKVTTILAFIAAIFFLLGGLLAIVFAYTIFTHTKAKKDTTNAVMMAPVVTTLLYFGIIFQATVGLHNFFAVAKTAGLLETVVRHPDSVSLVAVIVACIPAILTILYRCFVVYRQLNGINGEGVKKAFAVLFKTWRVIWFIIAMFIAFTLFVLCVAGYILMGNIVGDPWGGYLVKRCVGIVAASMTGIVPVAQALLVLL
ncbi:hypothetical protein DFH27DRAFT_572106 [Peziza echinospora]|nr:hypothetical protein DFH27DRAFT_572106 [Peziza echinospora]